jgi:dynein heavy chain
MNPQTPGSKFYNPYELTPFTKGEIVTANKEYFAVSPHKVVHVFPNRNTEVYELHEWRQESIQFNMLRSLNFFKYFILRKAFVNWRTGNFLV